MHISNQSDQELAVLLKQGDEVAFKLLYDKYWNKLYVVASNRLSDSYQAEEVVQDIFLNLWRKRETFSIITGFDNYFAVAVKFEIINKRAKRAREAERNSQLATSLKNVQEAPVENFDLECLKKQLENTISQLPPKCQLVFRMSREEYLTNKMIAEKLTISEKAVEKHKTHALKILRARFGHHLSTLLFFI